jgi:hypothetical protein
MRQNGVVNANEWRALEELDPISDADGGNVYLVNTAAQPTMQSGEKDDDDEAQRAITIVNNLPAPVLIRDDDE